MPIEPETGNHWRAPCPSHQPPLLPLLKSTTHGTHVYRTSILAIEATHYLRWLLTTNTTHCPEQAPIMRHFCFSLERTPFWLMNPCVHTTASLHISRLTYNRCTVGYSSLFIVVRAILTGCVAACFECHSWWHRLSGEPHPPGETSGTPVSLPTETQSNVRVSRHRSIKYHGKPRKVFSISANPLALQSLSQPCCSFSEASAAATSFLARRVRAMRATKTSLVTTPMSLIVIAAITKSILIFTTYETGSWVLLCLRFEWRSSFMLSLLLSSLVVVETVS